MEKKRLDQLLVERGLAPTRERAVSLVLSGNVLVNDIPQDKPGKQYSVDVAIRVRGQDHPYVSRGGLKLAAALDAFSIDVRDQVALDIGASTGGFTQVLLLRGAKKIHAVDVGKNQLHWAIRQDARVNVYENLNARYLTLEQIGETVDVIVMDVSFISIEKIIPALIPVSKGQTSWITLIKPQFEVGREKVGKGGIVRSEQDREAVILRLTDFFKNLGLSRRGLIESPITGTDGNVEYLAFWKKE